MKGIILAGGSGTRLYPITKGISKQLVPVYDKPMIYYPLSVLMLAGIREILIITTPEDQDLFIKLLGDGSQLGIKLEYVAQPSPDGLAQAFILGEEFIGDSDVCLVLGDNIFYGHGMQKLLRKSIKNVKEEKAATVFAYHVNDPERYGVVEFDQDRCVKSIEEKPLKPKSNYAVVGLYFYPNDVIKVAKKVEPSERGELEITSINQVYLKRDKLRVSLMSRGYAWLDTGTHESLIDAGRFIYAIEKRQGLKIACIEEIAYEMGFISKEELIEMGEAMKKNGYGQYLLKIAEEGFITR